MRIPSMARRIVAGARNRKLRVFRRPMLTRSLTSPKVRKRRRRW